MSFLVMKCNRYSAIQKPYNPPLPLFFMKSLTAIIKKGEKQFVALCPELDVVSQGYTVEEAIANLKEAVELYIEEMGVPEELSTSDTIVVNFEVPSHGKAAQTLR